MILVTYGIDKALYDNSSSVHNIVLTITMYSFQMKKLVHLQYGKLLRNEVEDRLRGNLGAGEQFMLENGGHPKYCRAIPKLHNRTLL